MATVNVIGGNAAAFIAARAEADAAVVSTIARKLMGRASTIV
jgi:hypothetical protein